MEKYKNVEDYFNSTETNNKNVISTCKKNMLDYINKQIKKEFQTFKNIIVYPEIDIIEGNIILNICEKEKYVISNYDENKRSLGFKCFFRIMLEIYSLETYESNQKIIYIIDEPEQSLHPLLQKELVNKLSLVLEMNNNITFILSTHSPYCLDGTKKNIIFIKRSMKSKNKGETITEIFDFEDIKKCANYFNNPDKKFLQENYLYSIIYDSLFIKSYNAYHKNQMESIFKNEGENDYDKLSLYGKKKFKELRENKKIWK